MDKIVIYGPSFLKGEVSISGAKNAALPILAATLLSSGKNHISNVPDLRDIDTIIRLLTHLGAKIDKSGQVVTIQADEINQFEAPYKLVKTMRASILVLGPLVARFKQARISLPGGCAIGERPINLHLDGLRKLGAEIELKEGYVMARADRLKGATIRFEIETVTGTENLMMAAVLAEGETKLENAAKEPEIVDLANYLIKMGAKISGAGTDVIKIQGVSELQGTSYCVMPDRIEAGTFLIAIAAAGGDVTLKHCQLEHLKPLVQYLEGAGVKILANQNEVRIISDGHVSSTSFETEPYPGFATDLQAQMMVLLTQASGKSRVVETIFENRYNHVGELRRMGARIAIKGQEAIIEGKTFLSGAPVMATDLRASASLIIAGLIAQGKTEISRVYHLDRGYEFLHKKLLKLGVRVERGPEKSR